MFVLCESKPILFSHCLISSIRFRFRCKKTRKEFERVKCGGKKPSDSTEFSQSPRVFSISLEMKKYLRCFDTVFLGPYPTFRIGS